VSSYVLVVSHAETCACGGDKEMHAFIPDTNVEARITCPHCTASQPLYDLLENL
jgi:hypothetical protein